MLEITFGGIEYGCADTCFDTGAERVEIRISFFTDPFQDLAELALAMLRGETEAMMSFTDEPAEYRLIAIRHGSTYTMRLEQWTDWFSLPPGINKLEKTHFVVADIDPKSWALQICVELQRIMPRPGVVNWFLDEDDEETAHNERVAKVAELEKVLMQG